MMALFKLDFDDALIDALAEKIADKATVIIRDRMSTLNDFPVVLTRDEAMKILRCGPTKMAELMARQDFPVNREVGVKIPTHMLMKWIEKNTGWVEQNTQYFNEAM